MWHRRVEAFKTDMAALKPPVILEGNLLARTWISSAIDSDSPAYVIVSYGAISFLFLGGIQLKYQWTLLATIIVYIVSSLGETIRILLAVASANSMSDVVVTSDLLTAKLRGVSTQLKPMNVYEDLGRGWTIVVMVFLTQVILIIFVVSVFPIGLNLLLVPLFESVETAFELTNFLPVCGQCIDIFENETTNCRDGTSGCPVVGTLGSWSFYLLGIFMACVFQLGPKTNFGESEQNPAFWLQLFLLTKQNGTKVTWYDPVKDKTMELTLSPNDWKIWLRFIMSFIVNGIGYHILVHALPIQVASQSSLTGVVFRAVGMMYLVDLDDAAGFALTVVESAPQVTPDKPTPKAVKSE